MKFECGDLEHCLATGELTPEAQRHLVECDACSREYEFWVQLSVAAKDLHREWESPDLWVHIKSQIARNATANRGWRTDWRVLGIAASVVVVSSILFVRSYTEVVRPAVPSSIVTPSVGTQDFLTEKTLQEVEKNEAAYVNSIQKLARVAAPKLQHPTTPLAAAYGEKLAVLDAAIAETRAKLTQNQFNVRLRTELAGLYTEKQDTLRELVTGEKSN